MPTSAVMSAVSSSSSVSSSSVLRAKATVIAPDSFDLAPVLAVHDETFVRFLETAWAAWTAEVGPIPAYPIGDGGGALGGLAFEEIEHRVTRRFAAGGLAGRRERRWTAKL
jgi:acetoin utilization deacetylase AcuC-like enzyme